jgi:hypothetical protein
MKVSVKNSMAVSTGRKQIFLITLAGRIAINA